MFVVTEQWLWENYGSKDDQQVSDTISWLKRYGQQVPEDKYQEWGRYKHLSEYQPNTLDIVPLCVALVGTEVETELEAHMIVNQYRCPVPSFGYRTALGIVNPSTILELGVGGDSAISTAIFLRHVEKVNGRLLSIDINPLGVTKKRYEKFPFWSFYQKDSLNVLTDHVNAGQREDMIFIDTIHSYKHTLNEIELSSKITDNILMDDITFEGNDFDKDPGGVKRAMNEWLSQHPNWLSVDLKCSVVGLLKKVE